MWSSLPGFRGVVLRSGAWPGCAAGWLRISIVKCVLPGRPYIWELLGLFCLTTSVPIVLVSASAPSNARRSPGTVSCPAACVLRLGAGGLVSRNAYRTGNSRVRMGGWLGLFFSCGLLTSWSLAAFSICRACWVLFPSGAPGGTVSCTLGHC